MDDKTDLEVIWSEIFLSLLGLKNKLIFDGFIGLI